MAFNGSGLFNRLYNWVVDRDGSIPITASRMDAEMDGIATGLSNCITKDGQTTVTDDIPLGGNKLTGVADATTAQEAATFKQLYAALYPVSATGGSGGSTPGEDYDITDWPTLVANNTYRARIHAANVGACNIDGTDIKRTSNSGSKVDLVAGELGVRTHTFFYDGTDLVLLDTLIHTSVKATYVTATDATWAPDPRTTAIEFIVIGGGGGSGGVDGQGPGRAALSTGGGGGSCCIKNTSTIAASYNITIGAGGTAGASGDNNGGAGGTSSVVAGALNLSATGGAGGTGVDADTDSFTTAGASGGTATGGDLNIPGGNSSHAVVADGNPISGSHGGSSYLSPSTYPTATNGAGVAGVGYGSGAGGARMHDAATNEAGAAGGAGLVIVKEYLGVS